MATSPADLTLEHVVPVSVLKKSNSPCATADARNIFLSCKYVNNARGNARFDFGPAPSGSIGLGHGNFIDANREIFYPRAEDAPLIARTLLRMRSLCDFEWRAVTTATAEEAE
eukprot:2786819-Rhodomonas_salina.1